MFKVYAFHHKLFCILLCIVLGIACVLSIVGLVIVGDKGYKYLYFLVVIGLSASIPRVAPLYVNHCEVNSDKVFFYQMPRASSWEKAKNNIDIQWNQEVFFADIDSVEIVKLTKEEKKTKVYYKHFRNKYLKINMKKDNPKYVYIGGYSESQIKDICRICCERK